jgi:ubiquinone/menaquinone biosynthesis C-methylase UbiE
MKKSERLKQNKAGWDKIADAWFGSTALPKYAPHMASEDDLQLFGTIEGKRVLDIGCGSGHSLKYMGDHKAQELWGLDLSISQLNNAKDYLSEVGYKANLYQSPMEENPGLPTDYFDVVYSIYALGWTVNLEGTIKLIASYLKRDGIFIMSWDHPILNCTRVEDKKILIDRSYHPHTLCHMSKDNEAMTFTKWKLSSYINAFSKAGMTVETLIEDVPNDILEGEFSDDDRYYSKNKAKMIPLSMIIKARKL